MRLKPSLRGGAEEVTSAVKERGARSRGSFFRSLQSSNKPNLENLSSYRSLALFWLNRFTFF